MHTGFSIVDVADVDAEYSERAGGFNVNLTDALGCRKLRSRVWTLAPGEELSYHRHQEMEECYFVLDGPGRIHIDGTYHTVSEGGAVRISPETPRQLLNDTTADEHVWLVVGAPAIEHDGIHL